MHLGDEITAESSAATLRDTTVCRAAMIACR